jgi:hypothetical protein
MWKNEEVLKLTGVLIILALFGLVLQQLFAAEDREIEAKKAEKKE